MEHYNTYVIILTALIYSMPSESKTGKDVAQFIKEINSIQSDWVAEENPYSYLNSSQLKKLMGIKEPPAGKSTDEYENYEIEIPANIPDTFDSRDQWPQCDSIASVKDQSNCASCWAVSLASAMSDRLCIASNAQIRVNLSAEGLISCCKPCIGGDPEGGCDGGFLVEAWKYWQGTGIVTGGDYDSNEGCQPYGIKPCKKCSYQAETPACVADKCTNSLYKTPYSSDIHKGKKFYKIPKDVASIQADILKYGPLQAGFVAYSDFVSYKKGVYKHVKGDDGQKHAVRILGWGVENNTPYWLVANSWGSWWGENGLFKIIRGQNECEFEQNVYAGITE